MAQRATQKIGMSVWAGAALAAACFGYPMGVLAGAAGSEATSQSAASTAAPAPASATPLSIVLELNADRTSYTAGDLTVFKAKADVDCFLTLISIDRNNLATVLFPNDFEPDNRLKAGTELQIPSLNAPYQLRVKEPGIETLIGVCNSVSNRPRGVAHDFERQRFTILGSWSDFTATVEAREAEIRRASERQARNRNRRRGQPAEGAQAEPPPGPEAEGRALLLVPVEAAVSQPTAQGP